jgi:putative hydrolase of the HAD superfamily
MNIIFDLGNVLFDWRIFEHIEQSFPDTEQQTHVRHEIYRHPDWLELDRGTLALEDAIRRGADRTGMPMSEAESVFIDDLLENLIPAQQLGMQTIQFQNSAQCKDELAKLGCIF